MHIQSGRSALSSWVCLLSLGFRNVESVSKCGLFFFPQKDAFHPVPCSQGMERCCAGLSPLRALWHSWLGTRTNLAPPQSLFYEYSCNLACGHATSGCNLVSSPRQSGVRPGCLVAWESCRGKPMLWAACLVGTLDGPRFWDLWAAFPLGATACHVRTCKSLCECGKGVSDPTGKCVRKSSD